MKPQTELERALIGSLFEMRAKRFSKSVLLIPDKLLKCPRCESPLTEHLPDGRWRRYFECSECWLAFSFYSGRLQPGRDLNPQFLAKGASA
jgi:hypothetical protein